MTESLTFLPEKPFLKKKTTFNIPHTSIIYHAKKKKNSVEMVIWEVWNCSATDHYHLSYKYILRNWNHVFHIRPLTCSYLLFYVLYRLDSAPGSLQAIETGFITQVKWWNRVHNLWWIKKKKLPQASDTCANNLNQIKATFAFQSARKTALLFLGIERN